MKESMHFEQSVEDTPQKVTKTKLFDLLEKLGLQYSTEGEGGDFKIVIDLPPEHIVEKARLERGNVLNRELPTRFDEEKFKPLFRAIKRSTNLDCEMIDNGGEKDKYIVRVFKKP